MRIFPVIFILSVLHAQSFSQQPDYPAIFGTDWERAETFVMENREWMEPLLEINHISYPLAIAVIFPELIRYSALRDRMEITLLKTLYINLGEEYANFSIGRFQIKPSFAEIIRDNASSVMGRKSGISFKPRPEYEDIKIFRKSIITDLEDPMIQFRYIIAFFKICEDKYRTARMDEIYRLKFLATAYNYGIDKSAEQVKAMIDKKFFNTKLFMAQNYSYADVSLFWYTRYMTHE